MPRCMQIVTRFDLGGAHRIALQIAAFTGAHGWESHVCAGPGGLPDEFGGSLLDAARGVHGRLMSVRQLARLRREVSPGDDLLALCELTHLLRRLRPDVVHTHTSKAGIIGRLAAHLAHVPLVLHTVHGWSFDTSQPRALRRLYVEFERFAARRTRKLLTVCDTDMHTGLSLGIGSRDRYQTVRWGVALSENASRAVDPCGSGSAQGADAVRASSVSRDAVRLLFGGIFTPPTAAEKRTARERLGLNPDSELVGWLGPFKPQKSPADFVRVAARIAQTRPRARFVMAGDGVLRAETESLAESYGIADRIRFPGWCHDVPTFMKAIDVLMLTSRWEGLPLTLMESAASGVPFVATDVGGVRELILDGLCGSLVSPSDTEGFFMETVRLLEKLANDCGQIARATRQAAERTCDVVRSLDAVLSVYHASVQPGQSGGVGNQSGGTAAALQRPRVPT